MGANSTILRRADVSRITTIESAADAREARRKDEETALLVRVGNDGDRVAFEQLYTMFAPRVNSYIRSLGFTGTGPDAVTQEVMLAVWTKAKLFDPLKASARTWVYSLARNRYIDATRAQKREAHAFERLASEPVAGGDNGETAANLADTSGIAELLKEMPPEQAEILMLAYVEGYSHREIAEKLGVSVGTTKSRARLAFKKLRARLGVPS